MTCPQCQGEGALFRGKTPIDACRMCASKAEAEWQAAQRAKRLACEKMEPR